MADGRRWTWSRVAHNVVEHIAAKEEFGYGQPICGRELSVRTQTFGDRNPQYPACARCERKWDRLNSDTD